MHTRYNRQEKPMKTMRVLVAVLVVALASAACTQNPTAPAPSTPTLGSGT